MATLCPHCGFQNTAGRNVCKSCGKNLNEAPVAPSAVDLLGLDQRRALLQTEIVAQAGEGWRIVAQSDTTVQLERELPINEVIAIFLLLLGILPGILYILFGKQKQGMLVTIDDYGRISRRLT